MVTRFIKGVFRMNPSRPKLCTTWEVQAALAYIEGQKSVEELSLKELFFKLVLLLALTSAARAHELSAREFSLAAHVKQSRPNHASRKIYLPTYSQNKKLCVVNTLREYRVITAPIRRPDSSQLLLALVAPHAPISSQTVSRWLKGALSPAEIAPTFTGHSTCSASISAAAEAGIPLELILEVADWASAETFRAFYHRPTSRETYANSVISS